MLIAMVALAVFTWGRFAPEKVEAKLYAQTCAATLLVWGLWWPGMVWATVFVGRAWCAICPLELEATLAERLGRRLGLPQRSIGGWLQSGALIVVFFAAIQALIPGAQLHRVPAYTSIFLWTLLGLAFAVGLLFKYRAFCRGFCPVGVLLQVYGRGGAMAVRPTTPSGEKIPCPSLLQPERLNDNVDCLVCCQCIQQSEPGRLQLLLRAPFSASDDRTAVASWPITLFVMLVSGFVVSELCSEWAAAKTAFQFVPKWATGQLGLAAYGGWVEAAWTLLAVPLAMWLTLAGLFMTMGGAQNLSTAWRRLALPVAVLVAAGHLCKGLAKFVSWIGFAPLAAQDPVGATTAMDIASKTIAKPAAVLPMGTVSAIATALIVLSLWLAIREVRLADPERRAKFVPALAALAIFFGFLTFGWGLWFA